MLDRTTKIILTVYGLIALKAASGHLTYSQNEYFWAFVKLVIFLYAIFLIYRKAKDKNSKLFAFGTKTKRIGFCLLVFGLSLFIFGIFLDYDSRYYSWRLDSFIDKVFDSYRRKYCFGCRVAFYGLISIALGSWTTWFHDHTSLRLWQWIKTGSFDKPRK